MWALYTFHFWHWMLWDSFFFFNEKKKKPTFVCRRNGLVVAMIKWKQQQNDHIQEEKHEIFKTHKMMHFECQSNNCPIYRLTTSICFNWKFTIFICTNDKCALYLIYHVFTVSIIIIMIVFTKEKKNNIWQLKLNA